MHRILNLSERPLKAAQQTGFTDTVVILREATIRAIGQLSDKVTSRHGDTKTKSDARLVERPDPK